MGAREVASVSSVTPTVSGPQAELPQANITDDGIFGNLFGDVLSNQSLIEHLGLGSNQSDASEVPPVTNLLDSHQVHPDIYNNEGNAHQYPWLTEPQGDAQRPPFMKNSMDWASVLLSASYALSSPAGAPARAPQPMGRVYPFPNSPTQQPAPGALRMGASFLIRVGGVYVALAAVEAVADTLFRSYSTQHTHEFLGLALGTHSNGEIRTALTYYETQKGEAVADNEVFIGLTEDQRFMDELEKLVKDLKVKPSQDVETTFEQKENEIKAFIARFIQALAIKKYGLEAKTPEQNVLTRLQQELLHPTEDVAAALQNYRERAAELVQPGETTEAQQDDAKPLSISSPQELDEIYRMLRLNEQLMLELMMLQQKIDLADRNGLPTEELLQHYRKLLAKYIRRTPIDPRHIDPSAVAGKGGKANIVALTSKADDNDLDALDLLVGIGLAGDLQACHYIEERTNEPFIIEFMLRHRIVLLRHFLYTVDNIIGFELIKGEPSQFWRLKGPWALLVEIYQRVPSDTRGQIQGQQPENITIDMDQYTGPDAIAITTQTQNIDGDEGPYISSYEETYGSSSSSHGTYDEDFDPAENYRSPSLIHLMEAARTGDRAAVETVIEMALDEWNTIAINFVSENRFRYRTLIEEHLMRTNQLLRYSPLSKAYAPISVEQAIQNLQFVAKDMNELYKRFYDLFGPVQVLQQIAKPFNILQRAENRTRVGHFTVELSLYTPYGEPLTTESVDEFFSRYFKGYNRDLEEFLAEYFDPNIHSDTPGVEIHPTIAVGIEQHWDQIDISMIYQHTSSDGSDEFFAGHTESFPADTQIDLFPLQPPRPEPSYVPIVPAFEWPSVQFIPSGDRVFADHIRTQYENRNDDFSDSGQGFNGKYMGKQDFRKWLEELYHNNPDSELSKIIKELYSKRKKRR